MPIFAPTITADMAKLVDVPDLGSGAARRVGSSPIIRTFKKLLNQLSEAFLFCSTLLFVIKVVDKQFTAISFYWFLFLFLNVLLK